MSKEERICNYLDDLINRNPKLSVTKQSIYEAYNLMINCYLESGKVLAAGNGGSAADCEHITGELMKKFRISRPVQSDFAKKLIDIDAVKGKYLVENLERPLTAIPLVAHEALTTAFINDSDSKGVFAQQLYGFGQSGDVFIAITTSGNSENILYAAVVARALGMKVIALTGANKGQISNYSDCVISVPESETHLIQEMHLPIYHTLCMMLEDYFFGE